MLYYYLYQYYTTYYYSYYYYYNYYHLYHYHVVPYEPSVLGPPPRCRRVQKAGRHFFFAEFFIFVSASS